MTIKPFREEKFEDLLISVYQTNDCPFADGQHELQTVFVENDQGERKLLAEGYAFERLVKAEIEGEVKSRSGRSECWSCSRKATGECCEKVWKAACNGQRQILWP